MKYSYYSPSLVQCWKNTRDVGSTCPVQWVYQFSVTLLFTLGGGPRVVVTTAAIHARVRGSVPGLGGLKKTKMFLPHPRVKVSIVVSLRDREVARSVSDLQGSNFESCVWRTVSSHSSQYPQEVQEFSLYVHKCGLNPFILLPILGEIVIHSVALLAVLVAPCPPNL